MSPAAGPAIERQRLRLDKWLWATRFYKTRELACDAIDSGQVRVDGERVKPSRALKPGDRVTVRKGGLAWEVEVLVLVERRTSAPEAAKAWREDAAVTAARVAEAARRRAEAQPRFPGRPTKRDRRALDDFLDES